MTLRIIEKDKENKFQHIDAFGELIASVIRQNGSVLMRQGRLRLMLEI